MTYAPQAIVRTRYIVIVALNSGDEAATNSLDSVAASLIHRLSCLHIGYNKAF